MLNIVRRCYHGGICKLCGCIATLWPLVNGIADRGRATKSVSGKMSGRSDVEVEIRKLRKKLRQIEHLERLEFEDRELTEDEELKVWYFRCFT